jgi:hypothetical protein
VTTTHPLVTTDFAHHDRRDPQTLDEAYRDGMVEGMSNGQMRMAVASTDEQKAYCDAWNRGWRAGRAVLMDAQRGKARQ